MGYRVVPGEKFFRSDWAEAIKSDQNIDAALKFAQQMGFPLIVKPNFSLRTISPPAMQYKMLNRHLSCSQPNTFHYVPR
jgi:hypothetical protein